MCRISLVICVLAVSLSARADDKPATPTKAEEIEFENGGVKLSGTLWKPEGKGPFPAVVWCHGSDKSTREAGTVHMAGFLRAGYAFLAWDKPGAGKSGSGPYFQQPLTVRAKEVLAAVEMLKHRNYIDAKRIGFSGISQAGNVLPKAIREYPAAAFCILLSPGAWRLADEYAYQDKTHLLETMLQEIGLQDEARRVEAAGYFRKWRDAAFRDDFEQAQAIAKEARSKPWFAAIERFGLFTEPDDKAAAEQLKKASQEFRDYTPVTEYSWLTCPTLILFGEKDICINPTACEKNIRAGFEKSGNKRLSFITYPGEGHGLGGTKAAISDDIQKWLVGLVPGE